MFASSTKPRLIIHGGAGNITRENLPPESYAKYAATLRSIHRTTSKLLEEGAAALDAATHAITLFEDCPLFNCGKGAVFTRDGTIELEASVMVSHGYRKRACGVVLVKRVKNPIRLAREMLVRGETDGSGGGNGGNGDPSGGSGGAQGHCCLGGETVERLAEAWGLDMVSEDYFWTRKRWDEHKKGLKAGLRTEKGSEDLLDANACQPSVSEKESTLTSFVSEHKASSNKNAGEKQNLKTPEFHESGWDGNEYLPQGTVGCVALDKYGTLCVATSTGGLTNKLPGRIGDTPTIGAGFWAEEWDEPPLNRRNVPSPYSVSPRSILDGIRNVLGDCLLNPSGYQRILSSVPGPLEKKQPSSDIRAVAMSGTGNGDSFLRLAAVRTAGAIVRFSPHRSLASAVNQIAGPFGELQRSAGDRWGGTGEGQGGIIGIELVDGKGQVEFDFNCGGMFRCWVDDRGVERVMVFRDEY